MAKGNFIRAAAGLAVLGLFGTALTIVETQTSFAGNCGGHCQAAKMCADLVGRKGVKGVEKRDEYQKCMRDPNSYK